VSRESVEMLTAVSSSIAGKAPVRKPIGLLCDSYFKERFTIGGMVFEFIEAKSSSDEDWEEWRSSLKGVVGGSDFASLMGHGYTSPRACLKEILGFKQKKPLNHFAKTCRQHGKKYEKYVIEVLKRELVIGGFGSRRKNLKVSAVYEFYRESDPTGKRLRICISPDYLEMIGFVVEVKCPYMGSTGEYSNSQEFAEALNARYVESRGRESYFLQALFYSAIVHECVIIDDNDYLCGIEAVLTRRVFAVAIGAVSNEEKLSVIWYPYSLTPKSSDIVWKGLSNILEHSTLSDCERYRITSAQRVSVSEQMYLTAIVGSGIIRGEYIIDMNGDLLEPEISEEQCEDSSGDDDPCPPRE